MIGPRIQRQPGHLPHQTSLDGKAGQDTHHIEPVSQQASRNHR